MCHCWELILWQQPEMSSEQLVACGDSVTSCTSPAPVKPISAPEGKAGWGQSCYYHGSHQKSNSIKQPRRLSIHGSHYRFVSSKLRGNTCARKPIDPLALGGFERFWTIKSFIWVPAPKPIELDGLLKLLSNQIKHHHTSPWNLAETWVQMNVGTILAALTRVNLIAGFLDDHPTYYVTNIWVKSHLRWHSIYLYIYIHTYMYIYI